MKKFLVCYDIPDWKDRLIVIWADAREDVKPILKKHLGSVAFKVHSIKEVEK